MAASCLSFLGAATSHIALKKGYEQERFWIIRLEPPKYRLHPREVLSAVMISQRLTKREVTHNVEGDGVIQLDRVGLDILAVKAFRDFPADKIDKLTHVVLNKVFL